MYKLYSMLFQDLTFPELKTHHVLTPKIHQFGPVKIGPTMLQRGARSPGGSRLSVTGPWIFNRIQRMYYLCLSCNLFETTEIIIKKQSFGQSHPPLYQPIPCLWAVAAKTLPLLACCKSFCSSSCFSFLAKAVVKPGFPNMSKYVQTNKLRQHAVSRPAWQLRNERQLINCSQNAKSQFFANSTLLIQACIKTLNQSWVCVAFTSLIIGGIDYPFPGVKFRLNPFDSCPWEDPEGI